MSLQVVRPVDNLERYNVTRSNLNIYHNVSVGICIRSPTPIPSLQQQDWAQLLLKPITTLLDRHSILATVVGDHLTGHPVFLRLHTVDLLPLIHIVSTLADGDRHGTGISRMLENEHNKPFDLTDQATPLWRLTIAPLGGGGEGGDEPRLFYLVYTFHHVIGDGRSAMALTEQLVNQLNLQFQSQSHFSSSASFSSSSATTSFKIPITSTKPIPASIESRVNCYPSIRTLLCQATRSLLLPGFIKKRLETKYWAGEIDSSLEVPNQTEVEFLRFSQDETRAIVRLAKTRGTTVQAVMYTASIFAIRSIFMSGNNQTSEKTTLTSQPSPTTTTTQGTPPEDEETLVFATPCSLRDLFPQKIAPDDQGNYVSEILHANIRIHDDSGFWAMTDAYRKQVIAGTTTPRGLQDLLEHFGALSLLSKKDGGWEAFMRSKVTKDQHGRKASLKLSNLGRGWVNPSPTAAAASTSSSSSSASSSYTIEDAFFSQSSGVTASALTMSIVTANGHLSIATSWQKAGFHGRERGEAFVAAFKRILLLIALQHPDTPELSYLEICPRR
ncbi:hypothetical protein BGX23_000565 [Mortierella sp. AD031]|nr:hypothetical protein BGX23_000565 [Mortierella sp. AD031]KAG0208086.1 hypothetical protein BGX33_006483 [Mortierella sp. NVP41]